MTEVMAQQQGFGLSAPSNRQDIVSALLNDYGDSFGQGDTSPYNNYSPVPALKELPPPPPSDKTINDKPLPSSAGFMSMRFQLRVDDEDLSPVSSNGSRKSSLEQPTKIVSRSLSRSSKPPSLRLLASNGATAIVPPTLSAPVTANTVSSPRAQEEKQLPLPPPPPPEKSVRRQQSNTGQNQTKEGRDRKDSMQSPEGNTRPRNESSASIDQQPVVKRKALPGQTLKKFKSLAELGNGPRGGKGGPLPAVPASRNQSVDQSQEKLPSKPSYEEETTSRNALSGHRPNFSNSELPTVNQMPPTPEEDKNPLPPPPKKTFAGMGLPSNPRARSAQEEPKHTRGKSSTGFDIMKTSRAQAPTLNTITPGPTPSPRKTEQVEAEAKIEEETHISPFSPEGDNRRPFSFEAVTEQQPQKQQRKPEFQAQRPAPPPPAPDSFKTQPAPPISPPTEATQFPPRTTSRAPATPLTNTDNTQRPQTAPNPTSPNSPADEPTTPPFTPLTVRPRPTNCPPITHKHLNCYSHHNSFVRSGNNFQPMGCMICSRNERVPQQACTWCYLRICIGCQEELLKVPGRDLAMVLEKRGVEVDQEQEQDGGYPSVVVWEADAEASGDDFS